MLGGRSTLSLTTNGSWLPCQVFRPLSDVPIYSRLDKECFQAINCTCTGTDNQKITTRKTRGKKREIPTAVELDLVRKKHLKTLA